jgi:hypothetical protein
MRIMMFRALVCCAALIIGLLAALNVAAQSAGVCSGSTCSSSAKAGPLNLRNFVDGSPKTGATQSVAVAPGKAGRSRHHHKAKPMARLRHEATSAASEPPAASTVAPALTAEATSAYAEHSPDDVQVVPGGEVNAIDHGMGNNSSAAEASAAVPGGEPYKPSDAPASANGIASYPTMPDDFWMGRFWAVIGNGYLALMAMIKQLFG